MEEVKLIKVKNIIDAQENLMLTIENRIFNDQILLKLICNTSEKCPLDRENYSDDYICNNILDKIIFFHNKSENIQYNSTSCMFVSSNIIRCDPIMSIIDINFLIMIDSKFIEINNGQNRKTRIESRLLNVLEGLQGDYIGKLEFKKASDMVSSIPLNYDGAKIIFSCQGYTMKRDIEK